MELETTSPKSEMGLVDYLVMLRRRWWIVLLCLLLLSGGFYAYASNQTPQYRSTSQLYVKDPSSTILFGNQGGGFGVDPKRLVETQIQLITSPPVRELAEKKLADQGIPAALGTLKVAAVGQTSLINVSVTTASPERSRASSAAVVDAFLERFRQQNLEELDNQARQLQQKIGALQADITRLDSEIGQAQLAVNVETDKLNAELPRGEPPTTLNSPLVDHLNSLRKQRDALQAQLTLYQNKLDQVQVDSSLRSQSVLLAVPAELPSAPVSPQPLRSAVLGAMTGLMIGVALAFLVDFLDDTIRTRSDATVATGLPVLGFIPKLGDWRRSDDTKVVAISEPDSPTAEAFRTLRTNVRFAAFAGGARMIMVTSPGAGEGKSFVSCNLATVAAEAGQRVILIDADLRRPRVHKFAHLSNAEGLTTAMLGERPLIDLLRKPRWERVPGLLEVLTTGPIPPNPSEVLSLQQMGNILETLKARADLVIIDSAPLVPVTDAAVLASHCDAVLLVVRGKLTSKRAARSAIERLQAVGARVIGFVLNAASADSADLPSYYYYYSYKPEKERVSRRNRRSRAEQRRKKAELARRVARNVPAGDTKLPSAARER